MIRELLNYMFKMGKMRDAQLEAIKTYLYLKIACHNKPLWQLFCEGYFNTLELDAMALTTVARNVLANNKAAVALLEYSLLKDKNGRQLGRTSKNLCLFSCKFVFCHQEFLSLSR